MTDTPPSPPGWTGDDSSGSSTPPPPSGPPNQPPPPSGHAVARGGPGNYDVMDAFRYGWDKFTQNVGPILLGMLVLVVASVVVGAVWVFIVTAVASTGGDSGLMRGGIGIASLLLFLVYFLLAFLIQAAVIRASLAIVDGRPVELGTLLSLDRLGPVIGASLLVAVAAALGSIVLVGGIVVAFLAQFYLYFILDRGEGAVDAIMSSVRMVVDNFVPVLLLYLGVIIVSAIGAVLCGVGLLAAFPVAMIATAYTFRVLNSEPVAA